MVVANLRQSIRAPPSMIDLQHQAATLVVSLCLLLLYGGVLPEATIGPVLGVASAGVLAGVLLMLYMVVKSNAAPA